MSGRSGGVGSKINRQKNAVDVVKTSTASTVSLAYWAGATLVLAAFFVDLWAFLATCFTFFFAAGLAVASGAAVVAAGVVDLGAATAGACAKDTIANPESTADAIRDLIFNMESTHL
jgi:hypothetical protein